MKNGYLTKVINEVAEQDIEEIVASLRDFQEFLDEKNIPLLYTQAGTKVCPWDRKLFDDGVQILEEKSGKKESLPMTSINESTILSVIRNDKRIILFQTIPDREIFVKANIDKSVYSANSARVIIANYSPTRLEKFINRVGLPTRDQWPEVYHSANVKGELMNELCIIKNKGYEISSDSNDVVGFAAPIFSHGHISGSVGIYLPSYRLGNKDLILKKVLSCAESISNKIAEPFPSAPDSVV